MQTIIRCTLLVVLLAAVATVQAEEEFDPAARAKAIASFIDEQTIVIVHFDSSRIEIDAVIDKFVELVPEAARDEKEARANLKQLDAALSQAGCKDLYVVVSLADLSQGRPAFMIIPLAEGSDRDALVRGLTPPATSPNEQTAVLDNVLFIGSPQTLQRVKAQGPDVRPSLSEAFKAAGDTAAQVLLVPTDSDRRVVEEMMPTLPQEIGGGPSTILTRGLLWGAVGADPPPNVALRVVIQSQDNQAAAALRGKWTDAARLLGKFKEIHPSLRKIDQALEVLTPKVEGDRLTLILNEENRGINALLAALTPPVEQARSHARRARTANNLKQIGLAMHNWYDTHKSFPAQANYDAAGKPLLSWRVHVLPFLGQQQLHEQFHLDEAWDSEHNRKLIEKMPDAYRSPASRLNEKGRTSYVAPVGEETAFPGHRGVEFKEIKDGTSNTILVVEVNDEHAVIWTRPEDLDFDPDQPARGLGGLFKGGFNVLYCDGSVHFLELPPEDPKILRARFTRAGREVIPNH